MILECKHVKSQEELGEALKEATSQIVTKKYESQSIYEGYAIRLRYGMAFFEKKCLIEDIVGK